LVYCRALPVAARKATCAGGLVAGVRIAKKIAD
jgi:hypothetical protein